MTMISKIVMSVDSIPKNANTKVIGNDSSKLWNTLRFIANNTARTTVYRTRPMIVVSPLKKVSARIKLISFKSNIISTL